MLIGADTETYPIRHLDIAPKVVCLTRAVQDSDGLHSELIGNGDADFDKALEETFQRPYKSVWHNAAFDLAAISFMDPDRYIPVICEALWEGRVSCTKVREKLLVLATGQGRGNLKFRFFPNGAALPLGYTLNDLTRKYLGKDRSHQKGKEADAVKASEDDEEDPRGDLWRYNYDTLDGWRADEYPEDAAAYAREDSEDTILVYRHQQDALRKAYAVMGKNYPEEVEQMLVARAYFLYLCSALGNRIDLSAVEVLKRETEAKVSDDALALLIASGVLRASQPARPYKNGAQEHVAGCHRNKKKGCGCPVKVAAAQEQSVDTKALHALIEGIWKRLGRESKLTETGRISAAKDVLEELKGESEVLDLYSFRQETIGILTREIPRMNAEIVHPHYNEAVSTLRISCAASKLYPSGNITNVDPRARECYIPDEGWAMVSKDYGAMELVTLAQKVYNLFKNSTLRDQINAGVDPHGFLGAQIAYAFHSGFKAWCDSQGAVRREDRYTLFLACKKGSDGEKAFFKAYRTLAKPTGLGYPGGLGPKTFIEFAKGTYGIKGITFEMAEKLREVWYETYPEMPGYFQYFQQMQRDHEHSAEETNKKGETFYKSRFWYESSLGFIRRGCAYTEGINGMGLQTEGALLATGGVLLVYRASFDRTFGSILYGNYRPLAFIHDEILGQVKYGPSYEERKLAHEVCNEAARLMVEGGSHIVPDVRLTAAPAMMWRWNKAAEPCFDKDKFLMPWEPGPEAPRDNHLALQDPVQFTRRT